MDQRYSKLYEDLNIRKDFVEILTSVAKAGASEAAKQYVQGSVSVALQTVAEETIKAIAGVAAGRLLKALLKVSDQVSKNLDKLVRAPFDTGVREANRALELPAVDPAEAQFREERLKFAIDELERAWTNAENTSTQDADRLYIRLLQGLCALEIAGGLSYARDRLSECASLTWRDFKAIETETKRLSARMSALRRQADSYTNAAKYSPSGGKRPEWSGDRYSARAMNLLSRVEKLEKEREALVTQMNDMAALVRVLQAI